MKLVKRLHLIILICAFVSAGLTYVASSSLFKWHTDSLTEQHLTEIKLSVERSIYIFDRILREFEINWEKELDEKMPEIYQSLSLDLNDLELLTSELLAVRKKFDVSNIHIIDENIMVVASTDPQEVGLDLTQFSKEYTDRLSNLLKTGGITHDPLSVSYNTGELKKFTYYAEPESQFIVNADINIVKRVNENYRNDLAAYVFGDFADDIVSRYESVVDIDLFLVTDSDQWSLLQPGRKIPQSIVHQLRVIGSYSKQTADQGFFYHPLQMKSYQELEFKTFLHIAFDFSEQNAFVQTLRIVTLLISIFVAGLSGWLMHLWVTTSVTKRLVLLSEQINHQTTVDHITIDIEGEDEVAEMANDIKEMVNRLQNSQKAVDALHKLSLSDDLSNLGNRRHLFETFPKEWLSAQRAGTELSILMIDIDYFKAYNDIYGHTAGDHCIQQVATCFKEALVRPRDLATRYGGEEFVCLLPETNSTGAKRIAETIRENVSQLNIEHRGSSAKKIITVSIGCLTVNGAQVSAPYRSLLTHVDDLLYKAKKEGRDKVVAESWDSDQDTDSKGS